MPKFKRRPEDQRHIWHKGAEAWDSGTKEQPRWVIARAGTILGSAVLNSYTRTMREDVTGMKAFRIRYRVNWSLRVRIGFTGYDVAVLEPYEMTGGEISTLRQLMEWIESPSVGASVEWQVKRQAREIGVSYGAIDQIEYLYWRTIDRNRRLIEYIKLMNKVAPGRLTEAGIIDLHDQETRARLSSQDAGSFQPTDAVMVYPDPSVYAAVARADAAVSAI